MKTLNDVDIYPGQRVAVYSKNEKWYFGVMQNRSMSVKMDVNGSMIKARPDHVVAIRIIPLNKKPVSDIDPYLTDETAPGIYHSRKLLKPDDLIMNSIYIFIDDTIFDNILTAVPFEYSTSSKYLGKFSIQGNKTWFTFSNKASSLYSIFGTLAHEMVHQWQWETLYKINRIKSDWHNADFFRWESAMKSKLGVSLDAKGNFEETDVDIDSEDKSSRKVKDFTIVLVDNNGSYFAAIYTGDHVRLFARGFKGDYTILMSHDSDLKKLLKTSNKSIFRIGIRLARSIQKYSTPLKGLEYLDIKGDA